MVKGIKNFIKDFYMVLIFIFLYAPIAVLIVFSFNDSKIRGAWSGFTLRWYRELLYDPIILKSLYTTMVIALIATLVSTFIGTLASIGIFYMKKGFIKNSILDINYLPVLNPDIVTAVALMGLFAFFSFDLGFTSLAISHIVFCIPYVILSIMPKLYQLDKNMVEAAMDLGAKPWYAIRHVIIPQIKPGIITGALMAFTLSIDDFVVSFFTTGQGVSNLSITIYSMAKKGINPSINALSTIMFAVLLCLLLIINKRTFTSAKSRRVK
ncbi:putative spermidine/putrescine ABC transporter, permease protein PotC [Clostridiales bacterium KA00134]|nr:putative spermidine/putrescine ABC transporter, permease protein PotC [Clostridiales bacterium KA00134]